MSNKYSQYLLVRVCILVKNNVLELKLDISDK